MTTIVDSLLHPGPMVDTTIPKPVDPKRNGAAASAPTPTPTAQTTANSDGELWLQWAIGEARKRKDPDKACWLLACNLRDNDVPFADAESLATRFVEQIRAAGLEIAPMNPRKTVLSAYRRDKRPARRPPAAQTSPTNGNGLGAVSGPGVTPTAAQPANVIPPMGNTGKPFTLEVTSIDELLTRDWPETPWLVNGLIPQGLILLAGKAKLGKSWLCLQLAQAVATGGMFLGVQVDRAPVLYLALEDNPRRIAQRAKMQGWPAGRGRCDFAHLDAIRDLYPLCKRTADRLAEMIEAGGYKLVIIDTLSRLYKGDQNDVGAATEALSSLQAMAMRAGATVILVDHHNKVKQNEKTLDPVTDVLGSTGKGAVADAIMGLYRIEGRPGAILALTGRDVEEKRLALAFDKDTHTWQDTGMSYATLKLSDNRRAALDVVAGMGQVTCQEVADALDKPKSNVYRTLKDLVTEGFLTREGDNYSLVQESRGCDNPDNFDNRDNSDNFDNRPAADSGYQSYQGYQSSPDNPVITDAPPPFEPSAEWQEVPPDVAVPPGGEYRLDMAGGKTFARWPGMATPAPTDAPDSETLADARAGVGPLVGMLASGPMAWATFAELAVNNHVRPDLVETAALECGATIYERDGQRWIALAEVTV